MAEVLKEEFESLSRCELSVINGGSSSELESKIYMQPKRYDVVLGLQYNTGLTSSLKWSGEKTLFSYSPMIILAKNGGGKSLIVPDARKSEVGKNFINEEIKGKLTKKFKIKRVSSWTKGLSLFNQSNEISFYTFLGSFYYFINMNKDKRSEALYSYDKEITGDYSEYFRFIKKSDNNIFFKESILSKRVQQEIWNRNYMFPAVTDFYPKSLKLFIKEYSFD